MCSTAVVGWRIVYNTLRRGWCGTGTVTLRCWRDIPGVARHSIIIVIILVHRCAFGLGGVWNVETLVQLPGLVTAGETEFNMEVHAAWTRECRIECVVSIGSCKEYAAFLC